MKERDKIQRQILPIPDKQHVGLTTCAVDSIMHKKSKASWARLIQKIYEVDPMTCPKCSSEMRVIAIITSEYEVKKILLHLAKTGKSPPGILGVA